MDDKEFLNIFITDDDLEELSRKLKEKDSEDDCGIGEKTQDYGYKIITNRVLIDDNHFRNIVRTKNLEACLENITNAVARILSNSVIISGVSGCGKTVLLYAVAHHYLNNHNDFWLNNTQVIQFYPDYMPQEVDEIIDYVCEALKAVKNKDTEQIIVLLDDLWLFPTAFVTEFSYISEKMEEKLNISSLKFISTMNEHVLEQVNNSWDIVAKSYVIGIGPERNGEVIAGILGGEINSIIAKNESIKYPPGFCNFTQEIIEQAWVAFAAKASFDSDERMYNYNAFLHFMDGLIGIARLHGGYISQNHILQYNKADYDKYTDQAPNEREAVAKHEAGHSLIAIVNPDFFYVDGICCLPDSEHGISGVTLIRQLCGSYTEENIVKVIAFYLAGRIAQGKPYSMSASNDLKSANELAREFVMKSGLYESIGYNFYFDGNTLISEDQLKAFEKEVKKLLTEAEKYAEKALKTYKDLFRKLYKRLLEYPIIARSEIRRMTEEFKIK